MAGKDWRNKPDTYGFPYAIRSDAYLPASDVDLPAQLTHIDNLMRISKGGPSVDRMIRLLQLPEGAGPSELYIQLKQSREFFLVFTAYFILPHELTHGYCNHLGYPQQPRWPYEEMAQWAAYKIQAQLRSPRDPRRHDAEGAGDEISRSGLVEQVDPSRMLLISFSPA